MGSSQNPAIIDVKDEIEENFEPEVEMMKDNQQSDEMDPPIITLDRIPTSQENFGPNLVSNDEEEQIQARPSQNNHLRNELKNLATSYNQEATKELEGLMDRANS